MQTLSDDSRELETCEVVSSWSCHSPATTIIGTLCRRAYCGLTRPVIQDGVAFRLTVAWNQVLQPNSDGISAADPKGILTEVYHDSDHKPSAKGQTVKLSSTSNVKRDDHVNLYPGRVRKYFPLRYYPRHPQAIGQ